MKSTSLNIVLFLSLLTLCLSSGCRLCCAPYDYCGPVYDNGQCANLMTNRCGSGVRGPACISGCSSCGITHAPPQNIQQTQPVQQMVPAPQPSQPAPMPTGPLPGPQVRYMQAPPQYMAANGMTMTQAPAQPHIAQSAQAFTSPQIAHAHPQVGAQVQMQAIPQPAVAVNTSQTPANFVVAPQQGPIEVQVYDEKGNFLGTEQIDANGNTLNRVPHPAHTNTVPAGAVPTQTMVPAQVMNMPQGQVMYAQPGVSYVQNPVQPVSMASSGGWKTRTTAR